MFSPIYYLYFGERVCWWVHITLKAWSAAHGFRVLPASLPPACVSHGLTESDSGQVCASFISTNNRDSFCQSLNSLIWKKKILLSRVHFSVSCRKILTITYSSCRNTFFFQLIFFKLYLAVFQFWPNSAVLLQSVVTAYKVCEGRGRERAWRSMTSSFRKRRLEHFLLLPLCTIKRVNQE